MRAVRISNSPLPLRALQIPVRVEFVARIAEFAGYGDDVAVGHAGEVVLRELVEHGLHPLARAIAAGGERRGVEGPHTLLVEQPVKQALWRQRGVEKLVI